MYVCMRGERILTQPTGKKKTKERDRRLDENLPESGVDVKKGKYLALNMRNSVKMYLLIGLVSYRGLGV